MFLVNECISVDLSCDPRHLGTEPDLAFVLAKMHGAMLGVASL
jgi:hypothetical protein